MYRLAKRPLVLIAASEMCERFAFFGVQGLLFLYLRDRLADERMFDVVWGLGGLHRLLADVVPIGSPSQFASTVLGLYVSLIYVSVVAGGWVADRLIGVRAAVVIGGVLSTAGYLLMAVEPTFLAGMALVVVGGGAFKGNIAAEFSARLPRSETGHDDAFRLFYIAMHLGMLMAPIVCGTLGQRVGWEWGFAAAACGMLASLLVYLLVGAEQPLDSEALTAPALGAATPRSAWTGSQIGAVAILLCLLAVAFIGSQQIYNTYMGWAQTSVQLSWRGHVMPTTWLLAIDTALELLMLSASVWFWRLWRRKRAEPNPVIKIAVACFAVALAFMCLAMVHEKSSVATVVWIIGFHALNGLGYAVMLPAALAFLTRCAPKGSRAILAGLFYLQFAMAALMAGGIGRWLGVLSGSQFWTLHAAITASAGCFLFLVSRWVLAALDRKHSFSAPIGRNARGAGAVRA